MPHMHRVRDLLREESLFGLMIFESKVDWGRSLIDCNVLRDFRLLSLVVHRTRLLFEEVVTVELVSLWRPWPCGMYSRLANHVNGSGMDMNVKVSHVLRWNNICILHQNHRSILSNCSRSIMKRVKSFVKRANVDFSLSSLVRSRIIFILSIGGIQIFTCTSKSNTLILHRFIEALFYGFKTDSFLLKVHFNIPVVSLILALHQISNHSSIVIK
jgi:hypothetical protein